MNKKQKCKELTKLKDLYRQHLNKLVKIEDYAINLMDISKEQCSGQREFKTDWLMDYLNGFCNQKHLMKRISK